MMRILFLNIVFLICSPVYSQISTSFSFGSLGVENGSSNVFTGPIVIDGSNDCMTLQNGINLLVKENAKGLFKLGCRVKDVNEGIAFTIFPNPSNDFVVVKSEQKSVIANRFEITLQDIHGANIFQRNLSLAEMKQGYRIAIGNLANGFYLVKVYSDNQLHTYKLIKTGNL